MSAVSRKSTNAIPRFSERVVVRSTPSFTQALDRAADSRLTSRSDYIRGALLDRLKTDGIDAASASASGAAA